MKLRRRLHLLQNSAVIMRLIASLICLVWAVPALAQAPRQVLLDACNDTPFAIGVAAAYHTDPTDNRVMQGWFEIPAGDCLQGGLGDIVGNQVWLAGYSGAWRWPAGNAEISYCTPARSFHERADPAEECGRDMRLIGFNRHTIRPFRSGWGRVEIRFSCADFDADMADLCTATPVAANGQAESFRSLEVCNIWEQDAEIAIGASGGFIGFEASGWTRIPATRCAIVYRGFPAGGEVWFVSRRAITQEAIGDGREGEMCIWMHEFEASGPRGSFINAGQCPEEAPFSAPAQRVRFDHNVARYTAYTPRDR